MVGNLSPSPNPLLSGPQPARQTVINGKSVVKDGRIVTMNMQPVVATHTRCAAGLAEA